MHWHRAALPAAAAAMVTVTMGSFAAAQQPPAPATPPAEVSKGGSAVDPVTPKRKTNDGIDCTWGISCPIVFQPGPATVPPPGADAETAPTPIGGIPPLPAATAPPAPLPAPPLAPAQTASPAETGAPANATEAPK